MTGFLPIPSALPLAAGADELLEHVLPHRLHIQFGSFAITNHIFMMALAALICLVTFSYVGAATRRRLVPKGVQNFFEAILSFLRTEVIRPALGVHGDRFTPFIWTVFFFILTCNLLGMFPVNETVNVVRALAERINTGHWPKVEAFQAAHFWGTATANFSITGGLAIVAFIIIHVSGIIQQIRIKMDPSLAPHHAGHDYATPHGHGQGEGIQGEQDLVVEHRVGDGHDHAHGVHHSREFKGEPLPVAVLTGIGAYIWNFAPHPDMGGRFMDLLMFGMLVILEAFGALIKPFALCIRLFANMLAGHLVLAALIAMIPFVGMAAYVWGPISIIVIAGCTALSCLELFVAFLQAYIFTFLTTLFIASAVAPEH